MPTPANPHCSDHPAGPLLVLEGMPGTGKTTTAKLLAAQGRHVIGEYTTPTGTVVPLAEHPGVDDDTAHTRNYLLKHQQARTLAATGRPVYLDRDWLSILAYAHSIADPALLRRRADWICAHLDAGVLALADAYLVLTTSVDTSLRRRRHRLTTAHPWSTTPALHRLAAFYADPATALRATHPALAARLTTTSWHHLHHPEIETVIQALDQTRCRRDDRKVPR
ncbi:AAA family ATPase [Nocardia blacklockiae]|uniref:AAA family ATPase n=1 Tax=Nocardia blacklockiae TaxID=480036 RepID=UPI001895FADD|nr:AAA family ATPase [Nocardia blacklockiae]MBF6175994.1 AAA family ATPase [Nocardia blacklockiae]